MGRPEGIIYLLGSITDLFWRTKAVKAEIHPEYKEIDVACACGASFKTRSTAKKLHVDICSECHPFYTGTQKLVDTEGRVEKFKKKYASAQKK